jgi:SAM-dependent methyltransferase
VQIANSSADDPKELTLSTLALEPVSKARFSVVELYESGLMSQRLWALDAGGRRVELPIAQWCADVIPGDESLLARCNGPTLDVGCGPGRLTAALTAQGTDSLGIDVSAGAVRVALARATGTRAVQRSVFEVVPGSGRWQCALLADGNIGIGGDPGVLLRRVRQLIAPLGEVHVEVAAPGVPTTTVELHLEDDHRRLSETFPWAEVGIDALSSIAADSSLRVTECWNSAGRWFATLSRA